MKYLDLHNNQFNNDIIIKNVLLDEAKKLEKFINDRTHENYKIIIPQGCSKGHKVKAAR